MPEGGKGGACIKEAVDPRPTLPSLVHANQ